MSLFFLKFSPLTIGNNPCPTCKAVQFKHMGNFAGSDFEFVAIKLSASKETNHKTNHHGDDNFFFHVLLCLSLILKLLTAQARGVRQQSVPVVRLAKLPGLDAVVSPQFIFFLNNFSNRDSNFRVGQS